MEVNNCMGCLFPPCVFHGGQPPKASPSSTWNRNLESSKMKWRRNGMEVENSNTSKMDSDNNATVSSSTGAVDSEEELPSNATVSSSTGAVDREEELPSTSKNGNKEEVKMSKTDGRDTNPCRNERESEAKNDSRKQFENDISNDSQQEKEIASAESSLSESVSEDECNQPKDNGNTSRSKSDPGDTRNSKSEEGNEFETVSEDENQDEGTSSSSSQSNQISTSNDSQQETELLNQIQNPNLSNDESDPTDWFIRRRRVLRRLSSSFEGDEIDDDQMEHTRRNTETVIATQENQPSSPNALHSDQITISDDSQEAIELLNQIQNPNLSNDESDPTDWFIRRRRVLRRLSSSFEGDEIDDDQMEHTRRNTETVIATQENQPSSPNALHSDQITISDDSQEAIELLNQIQNPNLSNDESDPTDWFIRRRRVLRRLSSSFEGDEIDDDQMEHTRRNTETVIATQENQPSSPNALHSDQITISNDSQEATELLNQIQNPNLSTDESDPSDWFIRRRRVLRRLSSNSESDEIDYDQMEHTRRNTETAIKTQKDQPKSKALQIPVCVVRPTIRPTNIVNPAGNNQNNSQETHLDAPSSSQEQQRQIPQVVRNPPPSATIETGRQITQRMQNPQNVQALAHLNNIAQINLSNNSQNRRPPSEQQLNQPTQVTRTLHVGQITQRIQNPQNVQAPVHLNNVAQINLSHNSQNRRPPSVQQSNQPTQDTRTLHVGQITQRIQNPQNVQALAHLNNIAQINLSNNSQNRRPPSEQQLNQPTQVTRTLHVGQITQRIQNPQNVQAPVHLNNVAQINLSHNSQNRRPPSVQQSNQPTQDTRILPVGQQSYGERTSIATYPNNYPGNTVSVPDRNMQVFSDCPCQHYSSNAEIVPNGYLPTTFGGYNQNNFHNASTSSPLPERPDISGCHHQYYSQRFSSPNLDMAGPDENTYSYYYLSSSQVQENLRESSISGGPHQNYSQRTAALPSIPERHRPYQQSSPSSVLSLNFSQRQNHPVQTSPSSTSYNRSQTYDNPFERYWQQLHSTSRSTTNPPLISTPPDIYQQQPAPATATSRMNYPFPDRNSQLTPFLPPPPEVYHQQPVYGTATSRMNNYPFPESDRYWQQLHSTSRSTTNPPLISTPPDIYQQQPAPATATSRMNYPFPDRNSQLTPFLPPPPEVYHQQPVSGTSTSRMNNYPFPESDRNSQRQIDKEQPCRMM